MRGENKNKNVLLVIVTDLKCFAQLCQRNIYPKINQILNGWE